MPPPIAAATATETTPAQPSGVAAATSIVETAARASPRTGRSCDLRVLTIQLVRRARLHRETLLLQAGGQLLGGHAGSCGSPAGWACAAALCARGWSTSGNHRPGSSGRHLAVADVAQAVAQLAQVRLLVHRRHEIDRVLLATPSSRWEKRTRRLAAGKTEPQARAHRLAAALAGPDLQRDARRPGVSAPRSAWASSRALRGRPFGSRARQRATSAESPAGSPARSSSSGGRLVWVDQDRGESPKGRTPVSARQAVTPSA